MCPFRTSNARRLPHALKKRSVGWFLEVMQHVRPQFIVCMGNAGTAKSPPWSSPWAALARKYGMEDVQEWRFRPRLNFTLRVGRLQESPFFGVRVLGVPLPVLGRQANYLLSEVLGLVRRIGQKKPFL